MDRLQYITVKAKDVAGMFRVGYKPACFVKHGIPVDAALVNFGKVDWRVDPSEELLFFTFEHESFPEILEGVIQPPVAIVTETYPSVADVVLAPL